MLKAINETEYKPDDPVWYHYGASEVKGASWRIPAKFVRYIGNRPTTPFWHQGKVVINILLARGNKYASVGVDKLTPRSRDDQPQDRKRILWYQLPDETSWDRVARLNEIMHRIFFDSKRCCSSEILTFGSDGSISCLMCKVHGESVKDIKHGTPHFLQSLDASRLLIESGKFIKVEDSYENYCTNEDSKVKVYKCITYPYSPLVPFSAQGSTPMEARCLAMLSSLGYDVIGSNHLISEFLQASRSAKRVS